MLNVQWFQFGLAATAVCTSLVGSSQAAVSHGFGSKAELTAMILQERAKAPPSFTVYYSMVETAVGAESPQRASDERVFIAADGFRWEQTRTSTLEGVTSAPGIRVYASENGVFLRANISDLASALSSDPDRVLSQYDYPMLSYLMRWYPERERSGLSVPADLLKHIERAEVELEPGWVDVDGVPCIQLSTASYGPAGRLVSEALFLDPSHGYLPRLQRWTLGDGSLSTEYRVDSFKELAPGFFVPKSGRHTTAASGEPDPYITGAVRTFEITKTADGAEVAFVGVGVESLLAVPAGSGVLDLDTGEQWLASAASQENVDYVGLAREAMRGRKEGGASDANGPEWVVAERTSGLGTWPSGWIVIAGTVALCGMAGLGLGLWLPRRR